MPYRIPNTRPIPLALIAVSTTPASDELITEVGVYLDKRLDNPTKRPTPARALKGPATEA